MRNPNGYGTVVKLSGKRRRPYAARITAGWQDNGRPIYKDLDYFVTREEALRMLADFNGNPYDVDLSKSTLGELYSLWSEQAFGKMSASSVKAITTAYNKTTELRSLPYRQIKKWHMQKIIDAAGKPASQAQVKNLFYHLDKYALEQDIITKQYSNLLTADTPPESSKTAFTEAEIAAVWANKDYPYADSVLFLLYTGFRISEALDLKAENINLSEGTMKGGTKTAAGKNRIVPIHPLIAGIVTNRLTNSHKLGSEFLFTDTGEKLTDFAYRRYWSAFFDSLGFVHTPHECRHTFRSRLDSSGANKVCIDLIMGHKSKDIGERIYTHKTLQELKSAILKITH